MPILEKTSDERLFYFFFILKIVQFLNNFSLKMKKINNYRKKIKISGRSFDANHLFLVIQF